MNIIIDRIKIEEMDSRLRGNDKRNMGRKPKRVRERHRRGSLELSRQTKNGIAIVILLLVGFLGLLSFFKMAGQLGSMYDNALAMAFGFDRLVFSFILIVIGALKIKNEYRFTPSKAIGFAAGLFSVNNLVHLFYSMERDAILVAALGNGGGYLGLVSFYMQGALGFWGTLIILFGLFFVSLLLISPMLFHGLMRGLHWMVVSFAHLGWQMMVSVKNFFMVRRALKAVASQFKTHEVAEETLVIKSESPKIITSAVSGEFVVQPVRETPLPSKKVKAPPIEMPISLLTGRAGKPTVGDIKTNQIIIQKTLEHFGVDVEMGDISVGPAVTQYTLRPAEGVKLSRITALSNDLALALAAHPIRIEAPIPGKSLVGIEVPNVKIAVVPLKEILESQEFKARGSHLTLAIGKDVAGNPWLADLSKMPHLLVAGTTGSGKTVCLNSIIVSLLYQNQPDELKFIMIDPKRVELPVYNGIPHLAASVVTEIPKAVNALKWGLYEMDRRFDLLSRVGARDITAYNERAPEPLPKLVFVIDELAELMSIAPQEVEGAIIRISQMARAVGIHLIVATQRPSVDVITGLIKANITSRIAFAVPSGTDSRTILDTTGAEKLLGRGDMLFTSSEISKPKRLQGAYLDDKEIDAVVSFIKEKAGTTIYDDSIITKGPDGKSSSTIFMDEGATGDPLLLEARDLVVAAKKASASLLQRRLQVGYSRAARLLDLMEERGWIGKGEGAKPRAILIDGGANDTLGGESALADEEDVSGKY